VALVVSSMEYTQACLQARVCREERMCLAPSGTVQAGLIDSCLQAVARKGNTQWSRSTLTICQVNVLCVLLLVPAPSVQWDAGWVRVLAACLRVIGLGTPKVDQGLTLAIGAKEIFV
jgi:hypothetical protein